MATMIERVLIAGLGSIGARHARVVRKRLPGARIAVLRRTCEEDLPAGFDECFSTSADALEFRPDAAVIAGPATTHVQVALPFAKAGVHLLIEKPIADKVAGVCEVLEAARISGSTVATGYNLRFLPSLERFRSLILGGAVGRVLSVRADVGQYLPSWRPGIDYRRTVSASASLGGGVLLELSHELDYLRWIFGEVRWVSSVLRHSSSLEIDVEDMASMIMGVGSRKNESDVVVTLTMDFCRRETTRCCTVTGEAGSARWDGIAGTVELFEPNGGRWRTEFEQIVERDATYTAEWDDFLDAVESGRVPRVSGEDGLATLRVAEAARESSRLHKVVTMDDGESRK